MSNRPVVFHIPVCPFSQRLEILLSLKRRPDAVDFRLVDITRPRDPALLIKTRGSTTLPVLDAGDGRILKESLVILDYLDETIPGGLQRRADSYEQAIERMLMARESPLVQAGYMLLMNQDAGLRPVLRQKLLGLFADINAFLVEHSPDSDFLFERFGMAETVFAPIFMRFWFLEFYEDFQLPATAAYARVKRWYRACLNHPAAQQTSREEVVKLYYDYAIGFGNGALPDGRSKSSFAFEPHWVYRPWPPADKYGPPADDRRLGLIPSHSGSVEAA